MQLYLVRHAQSANNSKPEPQRVEDPAITELGHAQAAAVASWVGPLKVDYLVTSAFRRTLETTNYITNALAVKPSIWRDLHEVGGCYRGHLQGKEEGRPGLSRSEISEQFPLFSIDPQIGDDGWWACKPYETEAEAIERADRMLFQFVNTFGSTNKTVIAVIHADFKVLLLRCILGDEFVAKFVGPMMNCGISKFTFRSGMWRMDLLNSITHIQPDKLS